MSFLFLQQLVIFLKSPRYTTSGFTYISNVQSSARWARSRDLIYMVKTCSTCRKDESHEELRRDNVITM